MLARSLTRHVLSTRVPCPSAMAVVLTHTVWSVLAAACLPIQFLEDLVKLLNFGAVKPSTEIHARTARLSLASGPHLLYFDQVGYGKTCLIQMLYIYGRRLGAPDSLRASTDSSL